MMVDKKTLRSVVLKRRGSLTDVTERSEKIASALFVRKVFRDASVVMVYLSYNSEVVTDGIVEECFRAGKRVCVPVVADGEHMDAVYIKSGGEFVTDRYGIREPSDKSCPADKRDIDLCVVPGSAFDLSLGRMGYGKGYYDRFLAGSDIKKIALAFDCQIVDKVPYESTDVKMDGIITESRVIGDI